MTSEIVGQKPDFKRPATPAQGSYAVRRTCPTLPQALSFAPAEWTARQSKIGAVIPKAKAAGAEGT
ncbi:MAG: hypothetical protein JWO38_4206 [Gemmataceae bacterium]|nr:hypothetical protein [Gemmataceae bacterium]